MTHLNASKARQRALSALQREANYFREQAAVSREDDLPDVADLWLALADSVQRYVDTERGIDERAPWDVALFDVLVPP